MRRRAWATISRPFLPRRHRRPFDTTTIWTKNGRTVGGAAADLGGRARTLMALGAQAQANNWQKSETLRRCCGGTPSRCGRGRGRCAPAPTHGARWAHPGAARAANPCADPVVRGRAWKAGTGAARAQSAAARRAGGTPSGRRRRRARTRTAQLSTRARGPRRHCEKILRRTRHAIGEIRAGRANARRRRRQIPSFFHIPGARVGARQREPPSLFHPPPPRPPAAQVMVDDGRRTGRREARRPRTADQRGGALPGARATTTGARTWKQALARRRPAPALIAAPGTATYCARQRPGQPAAPKLMRATLSPYRTWGAAAAGSYSSRTIN